MAQCEEAEGRLEMEVVLTLTDYKRSLEEVLEQRGISVIPRHATTRGIYSTGDGMLLVEYDLEDPEPSPRQTNLPKFLSDWLKH